MNLSQPNYIEPRKGKNHLELCGQWDYAYTEGVTNQISDINWNLKTKVPNSLFWSLYESGVMPHPYKKCNSKQYYWVDEKVWYYRKNFTVAEANAGKDAFLCIDGAAYYSRVWLNGNLLGEHEGMFGGPIVEIGNRLDYGNENELVIEIKSCNYGRKETWNSLNSDKSNTQIVPWNIARDTASSNGDFIVLGLWKGVRIEFLPKLHLSRPYLTTEAISENQAKLHLKCEIADGTVNELQLEPYYKSNCYEYTFAFKDGLSGIKKNEKISIHIEVVEKSTGEKVFSEEETFSLYDYDKSGINPRFYECQFYNKDIIINNPKLWFPIGMGESFLYTVSITLSKEQEIYDVLNFDYGIRTIDLEYAAGEQHRLRWDKFQFVVNGKKIFLKGMNWSPLDYLYKLDREEYRWAIELAKNAGIQLLRVWSGGGMPETDEFYELCDELGIMVWQDNFLANMETPNWPQDILEAQVCMNLYRIRNHPSLVIHCGGNEFNPYGFGNAASMFVIERNIQDLDPSRPFMRTSPDKGSAHIYRDMEPIWYRHLYKQLPFVGESGIHSFPNLKSLRQLISADEFNRPLSDIFCEEFKIKNPELINHFSEYEPDRIPRMLSRASQINNIKDISLGNIVEATQVASCEFYQIMLQAFRENYPVTTGIMPWVFKRPWTTIGIQLVDGMGDPIAPYYYVKKAYEPIIALVGLEYLAYAPGEEIDMPVTIINDSVENLVDAEYQLQVLDYNLKVVYERFQGVSVSVEDYKKTYNTNSFYIPEEYSEKYILVRVALKKDNKILSQSIYWPKCLECMNDIKIKGKYRSAPQENFNFEKGPWLKKQIESAPKAELDCSITSVKNEGSRVRISLEIKNFSQHPAFPVRIDVANDRTLCYLNDNYYFHNQKETKDIQMEIYNKNPDLDFLSIEVSAWNSDKITKTINLKG